LTLRRVEEVVISIRRDVRSVLRKYKGALGKASLEELLLLEEEAVIYSVRGGPLWKACC
jgi:hypothetical protein